MDAKVVKSKVVPFSLKDAPSLIERVWPAQKISVEAQKERKANAGQTLTPLGTFWKGRKPLVLIRACILAALLPATGDDEADLAIFETLAGISDDQLLARLDGALTVDDVAAYATTAQKAVLLDEGESDLQFKKLPKDQRKALFASIVAQMPYTERVQKLLRPEEVPEHELTGSALAKANRHLGTSAKTIQELIEQLGIMRFGRRVRLGDTFSGGGSIPFEAARLGCDVFASDLNPVACMLTWGALNIIGTDASDHIILERDQTKAIEAVDNEITALGIEHDEQGNRAKAYLYCIESASVPVTPAVSPPPRSCLLDACWTTRNCN